MIIVKNKTYISVFEASKKYGISKMTVYRYIKEKKIVGKQIFGKYYIEEQSIINLFE